MPDITGSAPEPEGQTYRMTGTGEPEPVDLEAARALQDGINAAVARQEALAAEDEDHARRLYLNDVQEAVQDEVAYVPDLATLRGGPAGAGRPILLMPGGEPYELPGHLVTMDARGYARCTCGDASPATAAEDPGAVVIWTDRHMVDLITTVGVQALLRGQLGAEEVSPADSWLGGPPNLPNLPDGPVALGVDVADGVAAVAAAYPDGHIHVTVLEPGDPGYDDMSHLGTETRPGHIHLVPGDTRSGFAVRHTEAAPPETDPPLYAATETYREDGTTHREIHGMGAPGVHYSTPLPHPFRPLVAGGHLGAYLADVAAGGLHTPPGYGHEDPTWTPGDTGREIPEAVAGSTDCGMAPAPWRTVTDEGTVPGGPRRIGAVEVGMDGGMDLVLVDATDEPPAVRLVIPLLTGERPEGEERHVRLQAVGHVVEVQARLEAITTALYAEGLDSVAHAVQYLVQLLGEITVAAPEVLAAHPAELAELADSGAVSEPAAAMARETAAAVAVPPNRRLYAPAVPRANRGGHHAAVYPRDGRK